MELRKKIFLGISSVLTRSLVKKWLVERNAIVDAPRCEKEAEKSISEIYDLYIFDIGNEENSFIKIFASHLSSLHGKILLIIENNEESINKLKSFPAQNFSYLLKPLKEEVFVDEIAELLGISKRKRVFYFVKVKREKTGDEFMARMIDISDSGCCVILSTKVEEDEILTINGERWSEFGKKVIGKVVRVREKLTSSGFISCECGIKFIKS